MIATSALAAVACSPAEELEEAGARGSAGSIYFPWLGKSSDVTSNWPPDWVQLEAAVLAEVNKWRAKGATCGTTSYPPVPPMQMNPALQKAARLHSKDMADNDYFDHYSLDGSSPWDRILAQGYTNPYGENIAGGYDSAEAVVNDWIASEGHCRNIMYDCGSTRVNEIGVGFAEKSSSQYQQYFTQDFGCGSGASFATAGDPFMPPFEDGFETDLLSK